MKRPNFPIAAAIILLVFACSNCKHNDRKEPTVSDVKGSPAVLTDTLKSTGQAVQQQVANSSKDDRFKGAPATFSSSMLSALADSLKTIGPILQQQEINPTKDNVIKGKQGTILFIRANSLVDDRGVPISSKAIIELQEHYSVAEFIAANLQTMHHNDLLQTQGMIYFSAKTADGTQVFVDKKKPIRVEFPVKEQIKAAKIFKGTRDENGNMNWDQIAEPSKMLVPFPIRSLTPYGFTECSLNFGITLDTFNPNWEGRAYLYKTFGDISKYENTLLATREFRDRYYQNCSPKLTKIYIDNLDKNMWEADELVVRHLIEDSTTEVNFQINWRPTGENGGPPTQAQLDAYHNMVRGAKGSGHRMIDLFKGFAAQKLTKIDPSRRLADSTIAAMHTAFVAYDAMEFGWVNVDYFFKDPKAQQVKLVAQTNETALQVNLVIPGRNIIMDGILKDDKVYAFTKGDGMYSRLPKGEKAVLFSISIANDSKLLFGKKKIIIGQHETEVLQLKAATAVEIKRELTALGK